MKLRDVVTGQEVAVPEARRHDDWPNQRYVWTEGNFSCDCNRAIIVAEALGQDPPEDPECGEERYELVDSPWGYDRP